MNTDFTFRLWLKTRCPDGGGGNLTEEGSGLTRYLTISLSLSVFLPLPVSFHLYLSLFISFSHSLRGGGEGAHRSSGSCYADPQGPEKTEYFDGNTERAPPDPHWEKQILLRRARSS